VTTQLVALGPEDDPRVPAVVVLDMPPGYVLFRHAHVCHRFEVVVKGSLTAAGRVLGPGDVMTAAPGEWYGPHVAGPKGCTSVEVFGTLDGVFRVLAESGDGPREYDFRRGEIPPDYRPLP
jgi:anti-sigma factor ChrR (cupin superfamily)